MKIKTDPAYMAFIWIEVFSCAILAILALLEGDWGIGAFFLAIMLVSCVMSYIVSFRQIELSESGVRIQIPLGSRILVQKSWPWSQLLVRKTYNNDLLPGRSNYEERIILAKKNNKHIPKSGRTLRIGFHELLHPLSFVCLNVIESANFSRPHIYPVSRAEFFDCMEKWGVPYQEPSKGKPWWGS